MYRTECFGGSNIRNKEVSNKVAGRCCYPGQQPGAGSFCAMQTQESFGEQVKPQLALSLLLLSQRMRKLDPASHSVRQAQTCAAPWSEMHAFVFLHFPASILQLTKLHTQRQR